MTKIYYNYNKEGYYTTSREARKNPLEKDVYLLPAFATFIEPLKEQEGKNIKWNGSNWIYENIPEEVKEPEPTEEELLKIAIDQAIENRKGYLFSTDWYILREYDQPNSYPQEIKNKRILARTEINQIEQETDIEKIVIPFPSL